MLELVYWLKLVESVSGDSEVVFRMSAINGPGCRNSSAATVTKSNQAQSWG